MELKQGYKQTDIGLIPIDWEVKTLGEIAVVRDGTHQTPTYVDYGVPFYSVESVTNNNFTNTKFITEEAHKILTKTFKIEKGDILMTRIGSIGDCKLIDWDVNASFYVSLALLKIKSNYLASYISHYSKSTSFQKETEINSLQSAIPRKINLGPISNIRVLIPTKAEQTAIVTVLSDIDELISQTEKLIDKKKAIKQGVMQELLKPKEGWVTKKFTDIVDYIHGKAHEQFIVDDGKFKVVNSKFISSNGEVVKYSNNSFLTAKKNDILTVLSDLPNGKALAKCFLVDKDNLYAVNQRVCIWRSKGADSIFLYYLLNRHKYFLQLDDGVTQTHILNGDINRFELTITEDLETQKEIGIILRDIDNEIIILEKKNDKLKLQKQGMMQILLTGKIRLI